MQPPVQRIITLICHKAKCTPKLLRAIYPLKHTYIHLYEYIDLVVEAVQLIPVKLI